ncbi:MAG: tetratricopeptide repeat protein [Nitrospiraceae bacterium]
MRTDKTPPQKADKRTPFRAPKRGLVGYSKKSALLEEAITHMNTGKYGRSSAALKELLTLDPNNTEARRLFATLHLRLGSLVTARQAFESLANEAIGRQDFWLAESLLREYLAAGPRCVPFLELLAHVYEEKGDAMAAVSELGKAIDILIESPDSDNPKKPSQLYAKVRALAPASSVAFQFASLFDIQTGDYLGSASVGAEAATLPEVDTAQRQDLIFTPTEEAGPSGVMSWEQGDRAPGNQEVPLPETSSLVVESIKGSEVLIDPAPVSSAPQELLVPLPELTEPILSADSFGQDHLPEMSCVPSSGEVPPAPPTVSAEPLLPSFEHRDIGIGQLIFELPPSVVGEESIPDSLEERATEVGISLSSPVESPVLSAPMPWEQIEHSNIRIEDAVLSIALPAQSDEVPLFGAESFPASPSMSQSEPASDQLASLTLSQELPEPSQSSGADSPASPAVESEAEVPTLFFIAQPESVEALPVSSVFAPGPPVPSELNRAEDLAVVPEPEVPTPSVADFSSHVPFSWSSIFDGAWKFGAGTSAPSSPSSFSKPDAMSQDVRESESVQPESAPEPALADHFSTAPPATPFSFAEPDPVSSVQASGLNEERELMLETDAIREQDLSESAAAFLPEEPSRQEESSTLSVEISHVLEVDRPVETILEPIELSREVEPAPSSFSMDPQPVSSFQDTAVPETSHSAVIPEAPPAPEAFSTVSDEVTITPVQIAEAPPFSETASDEPSVPLAPIDSPSHWSTGEVEVQPHRPTDKKRNWDKEKGEATVVPPAPMPAVEEYELVAAPRADWESVPSEVQPPAVAAVVLVEEKIVQQEDTRPEWVRASESITFVTPSPSSPATWQDSGIESVQSKSEPALSVAASAVDVLFDSTGQRNQAPTQDRMAQSRPSPLFATRVARVRSGFSSMIGSCFSTTQSMVIVCLGLALSCAALIAIGIGGIGVAWLVMEEPPTQVYRNLTTSSPQAHTDPRKNGYFMLLGFGSSAERDPLQAGYERKVEGQELQAAQACMAGDEGTGMTTTGASANVLRGWFSSTDPVAQMKPQAAAVRSWTAQEAVGLKRYQQWLSMSFEDVGYGQIVSPNCAQVLLAHRLYLAEGFAQDLNTGLGRLESDMGSWRVALGQSKTLMVKMLAATAVQDDVAIASGLLTREDLDAAAIGRLGKIVRPLDQVELSLRWPMQSHFVWATKTVPSSLKNDKTDERPLYVSLAAAMPLPVQRRANAYADYYEAASKAVAEGRYTNLPKPSSFIRTPAVSALDYVANPVEHIIGIEPLPSWDPYVGRIVETDARLRLAGLQVWIRRGPQEGNVLTRLAKAGQAYYDPFTGLPMLVNQQRDMMYSVGRDGKDQDGNRHLDVAATLPTIQTVAIESSRSIAPPRSK